MPDTQHILITGLGGTIGKGLLETLPTHAKVHHMGTRDLGLPEVRFYPTDFRTDSSQWTWPEVEIDTIIHLSQSPDFRQFPEKAYDVFRVNTASTMALADFAAKKGVKRFIYASTGGVYPMADEASDEHTEMKLRGGFYPATKIASELLLDGFKGTFDVHILRLFFVFGPHQPKGMLIPRLIKRVAEGQSLGLKGEEGLVINPIYYTDASQAIWALLHQQSSGTWNIGGNEVLSLRQIGETIGEVTGIKPTFDIQPNTNHDPNGLIGDIQQMKTHLHTPEVDFQTGVQRVWSIMNPKVLG